MTIAIGSLDVGRIIDNFCFSVASLKTLAVNISSQGTGSGNVMIPIKVGPKYYPNISPSLGEVRGD